MRYNPDKPGEKEIQVHCKNHNCINSKERGGWFTPTNGQLTERIQTLEKPKGFGESNFYCSQQCKQACPLFHLRFDPHRETKKVYTEEEYQTFKQFVFKRDDYICQFCGEEATEVHHEKPQKLEPFFALDVDYAWSCCDGCHYKYGHKTATPCSTGNLASKIC
jgi:5-methylcytosine-specific restriction endonuclease McrA